MGNPAAVSTIADVSLSVARKLREAIFSGLARRSRSWSVQTLIDTMRWGSALPAPGRTTARTRESKAPPSRIKILLLSPLLGPINAFAVNANLGRIRKLARSQAAALLLLAAIIILAAVVTFLASQIVDLPANTTQIVIRNHATLTDILIALILGLAAGIALFVGFPEILVGVAIAVAIVPPAAVSGIGLALFNTNLFLGALVLTLIYLFGLQLGSTLMLRIRGVLPRRYYQQTEARKRSTYSILILAVLLVILTLIVILSSLA